MKPCSTFIPIFSDLCVCKTTSDIGPNFTYHHHNAHEIYLFLSGHVKYYVEHSCYRLRPGDLLLINSEEMHQATTFADGSYERVVINVTQSYLDQLSSIATDLSSCFHSHPLGEQNIIHLDEEQLQQYLKLIEQIIAARTSNAFGKDLLMDTYFTQLMILINTLYKKAGYSSDNIMPPVIKNVLAYIEAHLSEEITLSHLQEQFFLSGTYISRLFKQHTGLTLRSYILNRRIMLAKNLLNQGNSVTQTCEMCGFHDYTNFIKSFHNMVGTSPGKFQKTKYT